MTETEKKERMTPEKRLEQERASKGPKTVGGATQEVRQLQEQNDNLQEMVDSLQGTINDMQEQVRTLNLENEELQNRLEASTSDQTDNETVDLEDLGEDDE